MDKIFIDYKSINNIYFHHAKRSSTNEPTEKPQPFRKTEWHLGVEIFLLLKGRASYFIEGLHIPVEEGDMVILPPNTAHSMTVDGNQPFERMGFSFPTDYIPRLSNLPTQDLFFGVADFNYLIPKSYVREYQLDSILRQCKKICASKSRSTDWLLIVQAVKIANVLYGAKTELSLRCNANKKHVSRSYEFIRYIESNLDKPLSVQDIAENFHLSVSHTALIFKKEIGIPINQYVTDQKMLLACKLLLQGHPPTETATMVGYDNYCSFFRNFKGKQGISPKEYIHSHNTNNIQINIPRV